MNGRFDPPQLERELLDAGIARSAFTGCRSGTRRDQDGTDDVAQIIDWTPGHPTAAERTIAQAVLLAHDRNKRATDEAAARQRLLDLAVKCENGTAIAAEVREAVGRLLRRTSG